MADIPEDISALNTDAAAEPKGKSQSKSSKPKSSDKKSKHKKSKKSKGSKKKTKEKTKKKKTSSSSSSSSGASAFAKRVAKAAAAVAALPVVARACPGAVSAHALGLSATLTRVLRCDWLEGAELRAVAGVIAGVHPSYPRGLSVARALQVCMCASAYRHTVTD